MGAKQKSIIDRCTASVYRNYQLNGYKGELPTLQDFREELLKQDEPEAKEIALAIELFTDGSLNTFAKPTNVDTSSRLLCYDILDLGKQLQPVGMLVILDNILNRITMNRAKGRNTYHKARKLCECDGQSAYKAEWVDKAVEGVLQKLFVSFGEIEQNEQVRAIVSRRLAETQRKELFIKSKMLKSEKQLEELRKEMTKSLTGDSLYDKEDIAIAITEMKGREIKMN